MADRPSSTVGLSWRRRVARAIALGTRQTPLPPDWKKDETMRPARLGRYAVPVGFLSERDLYQYESTGVNTGFCADVDGSVRRIADRWGLSRERPPACRLCEYFWCARAPTGPGVALNRVAAADRDHPCSRGGSDRPPRRRLDRDLPRRVPRRSPARVDLTVLEAAIHERGDAPTTAMLRGAKSGRRSITPRSGVGGVGGFAPGAGGFMRPAPGAADAHSGGGKRWQRYIQGKARHRGRRRPPSGRVHGPAERGTRARSGHLGLGPSVVAPLARKLPV